MYLSIYLDLFIIEIVGQTSNKQFVWTVRDNSRDHARDATKCVTLKIVNFIKNNIKNFILKPAASPPGNGT